MIKEILPRLIAKKNLTQKESYDVMKEIMLGAATPSQIAGFLVSLSMKGETVQEIAGMALAMRDSANPIVLHSNRLIDTCGTGGDGKGGLNISTAAAFVVAGAGFDVAKHGNRSISSRCGSADVLEFLGIKIDAPIAAIERSIDSEGIGFLYAPNFHPAMKHAMPTRRELGVRTIFNILGPLTNPAKAKVQMIGVYKEDMTKSIAQVLSLMGHKGGLVTHSNGWDEIMLFGKTTVSEMMNGKVKTYQLSRQDFGLPTVTADKLVGGDAETNAKIITEILEGRMIPARHVVVANAAAAIWIGERVYGDKKFKLKDAVKRAEESIDSTKALVKYQKMAEVSHIFE